MMKFKGVMPALVSPLDANEKINVPVLNQLLIRAGREEQGLMVVLAGLIVVMMLVVQEISEMFELIRTTFGF